MLYICFSAFNEEGNLASLVKRIARHIGDAADYHIVAFDDGSSDATRHTLETLKDMYPITLLSSDANRGLGAGMEALIGYVCSSAQAHDIAVFMDADDTHDPSVMTQMCYAIAHGADVVIASRYLADSQQSGIPQHRRALSYLASVFWQAMLPIAHVKDYSCGYRAYRVSVLQHALKRYGDLLITRNGFECQVQLLQRLRGHAQFSEVPIRIMYERKKGASKMRIMRTSFRTLTLGCDILLQRACGLKNR